MSNISRTVLVADPVAYPLADPASDAASDAAGPVALRGRLERGMATVEYAIGILLIVTIVGVMVWSAQQGWFKDLVEALFRTLFTLVTTHLNA